MSPDFDNRLVVSSLVLPQFITIDPSQIDLKYIVSFRSCHKYVTDIV